MRISQHARVAANMPAGPPNQNKRLNVRMQNSKNACIEGSRQLITSQIIMIMPVAARSRARAADTPGGDK